MEPMIRASIGGGLPWNQAAATEPVATSTRSPTPQPSRSKATSLVPLPSSSSISSMAPLGTSFRRLVDQTLPITVARSMAIPSRSRRPAAAPCRGPAASQRRPLPTMSFLPLFAAATICRSATMSLVDAMCAGGLRGSGRCGPRVAELESGGERPLFASRNLIRPDLIASRLPASSARASKRWTKRSRSASVVMETSSTCADSPALPIRQSLSSSARPPCSSARADDLLCTSAGTASCSTWRIRPRSASRSMAVRLLIADSPGPAARRRRRCGCRTRVPLR